MLTEDSTVLTSQVPEKLLLHERVAFNLSECIEYDYSEYCIFNQNAMQEINSTITSIVKTSK